MAVNVILLLLLMTMIMTMMMMMIVDDDDVFDDDDDDDDDDGSRVAERWSHIMTSALFLFLQSPLQNMTPKMN